MLVRERKAAAAALAALLELDTAAALPATTFLPESPPLELLETLSGKLAAGSPPLRAAAEELLRAQEALRLARREYYPDFAFMGSYMNKEDLLPEWELGVRVSIPLYFWRRQRAGVAEASFAARAAEHAQRNTQVSLEARLAELHATAESAQRLVRLYDETLIPQATLTLESARASYGVGRVDFLSTLTAFSALLEYRLRRAEEAGSFWRALAEIGPLVGETPFGEPLRSSP
jgi:outer membrane protein TolC